MADTLPITTDSAAIAALAPASQLDAWNLANPVGSWVVAYPGARGRRSLITQTRAAAFLSSSGKPVVFLRGYASYIALSHVDVVSAETAGQLLEQRHQFFDLDADSLPFDGATPYPYLPGGAS